MANVHLTSEQKNELLNKVKVNDVATNVNFIGNETGMKSINGLDIVGNNAITADKTSFITTNLVPFKLNNYSYAGYTSREPLIEYTTDGAIVETTGACGVFYKLNTVIGNDYSIKAKSNCENVRIFKDAITDTSPIYTEVFNGNYIKTFTATSTVYYIRFWFSLASIYTVDYARCYLGGVFDEICKIDEKMIYSVPNRALKILNPSKNLIDKSMSTKGYGIDYNNGKTYTNAQHTLFDFISVEPNASYWCNKKISIAYYNEHYVYIGNNPTLTANNRIYTIPSDCRFVRFSMVSLLQDDIDTIQFEKGTSETSYASYNATELNTEAVSIEKAIELNANKIKNIASGSNGFANKKLITYGDSITQGATWQSEVVSNLGFSSYVNLGVGGTKVVDDGSNTGFCTDSRISTIPTDSDVILIMGGTNDAGQSVQIGDLSYPYDTTKFKGALATTILKVQNRCPNALIVVMSLLSGRGTTAGENMTQPVVNSLGLASIDYASATREVASFMSVEFIDVFGKTGINQFNRATYIKDTVHPNEEGGKKIARVIINDLKGMMPIN